jgi:hypothetical protein
MIMPLRAFDANGNSDQWTLAKAIRYAVDHGAHVINMSFGTDTDSQVIHNAINYAEMHGVILVASAGNNNTSTVQYPAGYSLVTSVSATNDQDVKAGFSNYGSSVGVDGPGVNIISAYPGGLYAMVSGTSFSAPMVSATAALLRSLGVAASTPAPGHGPGPAPGPSPIITEIEATAVNINAENPQYVNQLGTGRINVLAAVKAAK